MTSSDHEETRSPATQAAELIKTWGADDFRAFAFYMCGFAPTEVIYFAQKLTAPGVEERAS